MGAPLADNHRPITGSQGAGRRSRTSQPRPCNRNCGRMAANTNRKTRNMCLPCYNAYTSEWMNDRYQANYRCGRDLLGGVCIDCGALDTEKKKLQFDPWMEHPVLDLRRPVGRYMSHNRQTFLWRIMYCDLVCHSCRNRRRVGPLPMTEAHMARREKSQMLIEFFLSQ